MKKIYFLLGAFLSAGCIQAQSPKTTVPYDFNPNSKYSPGGITVIPMRDVEVNQDRAVHYTENFDAGFGGWTPAIQAGPVGFTLTNSGHSNSNGNTFIIPSLMTSTPTQWVVLDSDAASTAYGVAEAATLTSAQIDLSGAVDISGGDFVALQFDQFFAEWQPVETADHLFIGVSSDGVNFTEIEISEGAGRDARPNPEKISWDISDEIDGTEGSVYLRFRWEGDWNYGWQIDNVEIVDIPEKDIEIVQTWRGYSDILGRQYSKLPIAHADTIVLLASIRNGGHIDQTNVTFDYVITDPMGGMTSGTSGSVIANLPNAELDTVIWSTDYVPSMLGTYTIEWTATSADGDDNLANNTASDAYFEITESTMAMDYPEGSKEEIVNFPLWTGEADFGFLAEFQVNDAISAFEFELTNYASNVGEEVIAKVYVFDDVAGEWNEFWSSNPNNYIVDAADLGSIVTMPVPNGLPVNNTDAYILTVGQFSDSPDPLFVRQGDIGWSGGIQGYSDAAPRGFFDRKSPIVRARINAGEVGIEDETIEDKFVIYPNPANEEINISLVVSNSENTTVNVVDITGKVITTMNLGTVNGEKNFSVSLTDLSTGVYFVEMVNADSKQVKKFVKK